MSRTPIRRGNKKKGCPKESAWEQQMQEVLISIKEENMGETRMVKISSIDELLKEIKNDLDNSVMSVVITKS